MMSMRALCALLLVASSLGLEATAQDVSLERGGDRLLVSPTARPTPAGHWSVGLTQVVVPSTSFGVGHGASVTARLVYDLDSEPDVIGGFVEPRLTIVDRSELAIALGVSGFMSSAPDPRGRGIRASAVPFVVATVAASDVTDVTLGVGMRVNTRQVFGGWQSDGVDSSVRYDFDFYQNEVPSHRTYVVPSPVLSAGIETRLSPSVTWVTEVSTLPDQWVRYRIPSLCAGCPLPPMPLREAPVLERGGMSRETLIGSAIRFQPSRFGIDAGVAAVRSQSEWLPMPWLSGTFALRN